MTDHVLDKITFDPTTTIAPDAAHHPAALKPIPWPDALRPIGMAYSTLIPKSMSVIVTWTAAEWKALCDVLDPDGEDVDYVDGFASYLPNLTDRSPAKDAKCLARTRTVNGNGKSILLVHSMLHLATDDDTLPLRRLLAQIIDETGCERIITTGTAGGIGADAQLGDVTIALACKFDCQRTFKGAPFATQRFDTTLAVEIDPSVFDLVPVNLDQLTGERSSSWKLLRGDIITTDFFCFSTSDDHYGLRAYDDIAHAVEMDDATLGLVIADRLVAGKPAPFWTAVRNASDPEADMNRYATEADAATAMGLIYRRYGYWTSVPSVIVSWLMAVG